jgi:hypothetical protein
VPGVGLLCWLTFLFKHAHHKIRDAVQIETTGTVSSFSSGFRTFLTRPWCLQKKLLYMYYEICPKHDANGKLKQEMILVWYAPILSETVSRLSILIHHTGSNGIR